jgi:hypothetical protein
MWCATFSGMKPEENSQISHFWEYDVVCYILRNETRRKFSDFSFLGI